jgi:hypothetical protein
MLALRGLAHRYQHLDDEITLLTGKLDQLTPPPPTSCASCWASAPTAPPRC